MHLLISYRKAEMKAVHNKLRFYIIVLLLAAGTLAGTARAQGYGIGTPLEAKKMVEDAIAYLRAKGEEKTLQELDKSNGKFQWRDLYVFAYDLKGVVKGHPNHKLIGQNLYSEPDSRGKLFRRDIVDVAGSRGYVWVDYTYVNPMTRLEEAKITYCQREGGLIVCCGAYLP